MGQSAEATSRAENKLVQLRAAQAAGFSIPRTLVSQDPQAIRAFCAELLGPAVIKTVRGTLAASCSPYVSPMITSPTMTHSASARRSFRSTCQGRATCGCCGGRCAHAVQIETERLDWRLDLDTPIIPVQLDADLERQLADVLERLVSEWEWPISR